MTEVRTATTAAQPGASSSGAVLRAPPDSTIGPATAGVCLVSRRCRLPPHGYVLRSPSIDSLRHRADQEADRFAACSGVH